MSLTVHFRIQNEGAFPSTQIRKAATAAFRIPNDFSLHKSFLPENWKGGREEIYTVAAAIDILIRWNTAA